MLELMYDISSGSTYKFNTAFLGEQVRPLRTTIRCIDRRMMSAEVETCMAERVLRCTGASWGQYHGLCCWWKLVVLFFIRTGSLPHHSIGITETVGRK